MIDKEMYDNNDEGFDVIVSYYQHLATNYAESIYNILTKNFKLKVYVNHLYQDKIPNLY